MITLNTRNALFFCFSSIICFTSLVIIIRNVYLDSYFLHKTTQGKSAISIIAIIVIIIFTVFIFILFILLIITVIITIIGHLCLSSLYNYYLCQHCCLHHFINQYQYFHALRQHHEHHYCRVGNWV